MAQINLLILELKACTVAQMMLQSPRDSPSPSHDARPSCMGDYMCMYGNRI